MSVRMCLLTRDFLLKGDILRDRREYTDSSRLDDRLGHRVSQYFALAGISTGYRHGDRQRPRGTANHVQMRVSNGLADSLANVNPDVVSSTPSAALGLDSATLP